MAKRLKILLTGSNGFLGSHLKKFFQENGFEISAFNRVDVDNLIQEYYFQNCIIKKNYPKIPVLNQEKFIGRCLRSILQQTLDEEGCVR